jgi:hypothetical protein
VDGLRVSSHSRLLESLGEGRVGVAGTGDVLAGGTVLEGQGSLSNHLAGVGADNVGSENAVSLGVSDDLDHAVGVEVGLGAGVGAEGEGADAVLDAGLLEVLLGLADPGDLGEGVHDAGDAAVVDVAVALLDVLDDGNGLLLGLVRQHGAEGDITNAADVRDCGAVFAVDHNTAAVVLLDSHVLKTKTTGVGAAADGDQNNVGVNL